MITLETREWRKLNSRLHEEWPRSTMLIRSKMKEDLGFTVREHKWYTVELGFVTQICLDFYDDTKETWFRMKYL